MLRLEIDRAALGGVRIALMGVRRLRAAAVAAVVILALAGLSTAGATQGAAQAPTPGSGQAVFGGSYADLAAHQQAVFDDFIGRYNEIMGTSLVAGIERLNGAIAGAGGDLQFRASVKLTDNARAILDESVEFSRKHDNTMFHKNYPLNYRQDDGPPEPDANILTSVPGVPRIGAGADLSATAADFLSAWLVEGRPEEALAYVAEESYACVLEIHERPANTDLASLKLLASMLETAATVGDIDDLSVAVAPLPVSNVRMEPRRHENEGTFTLLRVPPDVVSTLPCTRPPGAKRASICRGTSGECHVVSNNRALGPVVRLVLPVGEAGRLLAGCYVSSRCFLRCCRGAAAGAADLGNGCGHAACRAGRRGLPQPGQRVSDGVVRRA